MKMMTTKYRGVKIAVVKKDHGMGVRTCVHIIGPKFHRICKFEPGWLHEAIEYIDLRLSGQLHPKINFPSL